jgi:hypothetical protein
MTVTRRSPMPLRVKAVCKRIDAAPTCRTSTHPRAAVVVWQPCETHPLTSVGAVDDLR